MFGEELEGGRARIDAGHGRRAAFEAAGCGRRDRACVVSKAKTSRCAIQLGGGGKRFDEHRFDVKKGQAGRSEQIFERAGDKEIDIEGFHVDRTRAAILVAIEEDEAPGRGRAA